MTTNADSAQVLTNWNAPLTDEIDAVELQVDGVLPPELEGYYIRNGGNALPGKDAAHSFVGQGMLHGVKLSDGRAKWYRNRWVKTPLMQGAVPYGADGTHDLRASTANTSVMPYNNALYALVENSLPFEITTELDTVGPYDFTGRLKTPMTAHPKRDPATGELHFFGYDLRPPFLTYHLASPEGHLLHSEIISVTGPTMMHDFAITEHYIIWLDMPVIFDRELAMRRGMPFRWSDDYPPRIGIMPRDGGNAQAHWYNVEPGYAFHVGNAHEDESGRVILEAVNYKRDAFISTWSRLGGVALDHPVISLCGATLYRWTIDLTKGTVSEEPIDDAEIEFPMINRANTGRANRYTYAITLPLLTEDAGGHILKFDRTTGGRTVHDLGEGWVPGETAFVPAQGATSEDDGWLISIVTHRTADAARLLIHDASKVESPVIAAVTLPRRVPTGFHGAWIPESSLT